MGQRPLLVPQGQTPRLDEGMESAEGGEEKLEPSKSQDVPAFHSASLCHQNRRGGEASQETPGIL